MIREVQAIAIKIKSDVINWDKIILDMQHCPKNMMLNLKINISKTYSIDDQKLKLISQDTYQVIIKINSHRFANHALCIENSLHSQLLWSEVKSDLVRSGLNIL